MNDFREDGREVIEWAARYLERVAELLQWAIDEQAASAGRRQDDGSGGEEVRARMALLTYSAPPVGSEQGAASPKRRRAKR